MLKIKSYLPAIFSGVISLFIAALVYAWTEPAFAPPNGNQPMPLNISNTPQSKEANLLLNSAGVFANGLIVANGNVGIGTASPKTWTKTEIVTSASTGLLAGYDAGGGVMIGYSGNIIQGRTGASQGDNGDLLLNYFGGNVGIGTANPGFRLEVNGNAGKPGGGAWANSSDSRLKTDIADLNGSVALSAINALRPVSYKWINPDLHGGDAGMRFGFIAQDLRKIFPIWVNEIDAQGKDKDLVGVDGKSLSMTFPYDFDSLLVKAVQEQQAMIEKQEMELENLKMELEAIKKLLK